MPTAIPGVDAIPNIPFTAWEQAVFVSLFVLFVITIIIILSNNENRRQKSWQDFIEQENAKTTKAYAEQAQFWRNRVLEQGEIWRRFIEDMSKRECVSMDKITIALDKLFEKLDATQDAVIGELLRHDSKVEERVGRAVSEVNGKSTVTKRSQRTPQKGE